MKSLTKMVKVDISTKSIAVLALKLAGFTGETIEKASKATNDNRLKDFCYVGPKTICDLFRDIQDPSLSSNCIPNPNPSYLIYALYFLKKYPTAHEFAARSGCGTVAWLRLSKFA